jgi:hypothetical protein
MQTVEKRAVFGSFMVSGRILPVMIRSAICPFP